MASNYKRVRKQFDYMNCDDFAAYLSEMAAKGWHFKIWEDGLVFEEGEPADVTYAVEIFDKAKERDLGPEEATFEFSEYCESAGWKFIDSRRKFCILKKIKEDAMPLFTPEERVKNTLKATFNIGEIIGLILTIGVATFLIKCFSMPGVFKNYIFENRNVLWFLVISVTFLALLCSRGYWVWKRAKFKADIKAGKEIYIGNRRKGPLFGHVVRVFCLIAAIAFVIDLCQQGEVGLAIFALVMAGVIILFYVFLMRERPERGKSRIIQIGFFALFFLVLMLIAENSYRPIDTKKIEQEMPFWVTDYREYPYASEYEFAYIEQKRSVFGSNTEYEAFYRTGERTSQLILYYTYESRYDWVLNKIWSDARKEAISGGITYCTDDWDALEAFRNNLGDYYVKYDNVIFVLHELSDVYLTKDQIGIIRHKMDLK